MRNNKWKGNTRKHDSKWEKKLEEGILKNCDYHPSPRIEYTIDHKYQPDFRFTKEGKTIYIEAKGRFQDSAEASKYIWIRDTLKDDEELIFLFQKPTTPMPHAKVRKDGTKRTHSDWADKNDFRWFTEATIVSEIQGIQLHNYAVDRKGPWS